MSRAKRNFSPEFREEAVKLVIETSRPIAAVARELGIGEGTLGNWVAAYRRDLRRYAAWLAASPSVRLSLNISPATTMDPDWWTSIESLMQAHPGAGERERLRQLEREARELRMENEFLKKAAAYFAKDHR